MEEDGIEENGLSLNATAENYVDNTIRKKKEVVKGRSSNINTVKVHTASLMKR